MNQTTIPPTTPIFSSDPHKDVIPHTYVVQVSTFKCLNCSSSSSSCEVFARTWFKGQWGKPFSNLRPIKGEQPKYNLPIEILHKQTDAVPFCHSCPNPSTITSKLPYPPAATQTVTGASFGASDKTPTEPPKHKEPKKPRITTDDLISDLDL